MQRENPFSYANGKILKPMENHDAYPQAINTA